MVHDEVRSFSVQYVVPILLEARFAMYDFPTMSQIVLDACLGKRRDRNAAERGSLAARALDNIVG